MVSVALLSGVSLITMKLMGDQSNNQAFLKTSAGISGVISQVESYVTKPETCTLMFQNLVVPTTGSTVLGVNDATNLDASVLKYMRPSDGMMVNVLGEQKYGDFSIPNNGIRLEPSAFGRTVAELVITFQIDNKSFLARGKNDITKRMQFVVQLNAASQIVKCGPVLTDSEDPGKKKMCDSLGGTATWNGTRCVLRHVACPYGQVATRITSLGGVVCENIRDKINLNEIFDLTPSTCSGVNPRMQVVNEAGKFRIICVP